LGVFPLLPIRSWKVCFSAEYPSIAVNQLAKSRTDISLDGNWLFMPDYQLNDKDKEFLGQTAPPVHWQLRNDFTFWKMHL
ncbi:hypothetical protein, partial [Bacteroides sp. 51]|uniref:hypothetical protein n=1 Tax=Bacteroides sp. 51 TaxID=2302938 RepID=UPI0013D22418